MNSSMKKILFADDSPSMRLFASLSLSDEFEVDTACDGEDALKYLKTNDYDLFFVDVYMPKIDGISLVKKIRENENSRFKPVIIISTEADEDLFSKGRNAGATGWLVKPFDKDYLLKTVKHILFGKGRKSYAK